MGMFLLAVSGAILFMGGAMFDATSRTRVRPVIFQPGGYSRDRISDDKLETLEDMSADALRTRLLKRFVTEYFYVLPIHGDTARRTDKSSALYLMSSDKVFEDWQKNVLPGLDKMADRRILRRVRVFDEVIQQAGSDYVTVNYELSDFEPDRLDADPVITRGTMLVKLNFARELVATFANGARFDAGKYLDAGGDPATMFNFRVLDVRR